jgi:hypothetical protein
MTGTVLRQLLIVLLFGVLIGLVLAGAVMSRTGLFEQLAIRTGSLIARPEAGPPSRVEIRMGSPSGSPAPPPATTAGPGAAPEPTAGGAPGRVTVVYPPVYSYPADDHSGSGSGGGPGGGSGGGSGGDHHG